MTPPPPLLPTCRDEQANCRRAHWLPVAAAGGWMADPPETRPPPPTAMPRCVSAASAARGMTQQPLARQSTTPAPREMGGWGKGPIRALPAAATVATVHLRHGLAAPHAAATVKERHARRQQGLLRRAQGGEPTAAASLRPTARPLPVRATCVGVVPCVAWPHPPPSLCTPRVAATAEAECGVNYRREP